MFDEIQKLISRFVFVTNVEIDSKNKEIYFKELDDFFDFFNDDILDSSFFKERKYTIDSKRIRSRTSPNEIKSKEQNNI